jgi:hypothetical protein
MFKRCKVPYEVNRSTRDLDEIPYWKANEWKTWLIVCIPILRGILSDKYLDHLQKFVVALSLLLQDKISPDQCDSAEELFKEFCDEAVNLYGKQVCTFNMHLLLHFVQCVRDFGPLWAYSLFQYENANGELTKLFSGTRQVGMQIVKKVCVMEKLRSASASCMRSKDKAQFLESMIDKKKFYKHSVKCNNRVTLVGPRKNYTLSEYESRKLSKKEGIETDGIAQIWSYKHFFVKGHKFCNTLGDSARCKNSIALILSKFYSISKILLITYHTRPAEAVVFCSEIKVSSCAGFEETKFVLKVTGKSTKTSIFRCEMIENLKCITIVGKDGNPLYLSKLLNSAELE